MPILGIIASSKSKGKVGFNSIATITMAGGETSATFSSIPQTYTDLQLRVFAKDTNTSIAAAASVLLQFNADSGTNYVFHNLQGDSSAVTASGSITQTYIPMNASMLSGTGQTSVFGVGIMDIYDYTSASKFKTTKAIAGGDYNASSTTVGIAMSSGLWQNTAAITSLTVNKSSTAFAAGTVLALYGIKAFS